jgi:hypothetical protein
MQGAVSTGRLLLGALVLATLALGGGAARASAPQTGIRLNYGSIHIDPIRGADIVNDANNLMYWGGPVMRKTSRTYGIFWEPPQLQSGAATGVSATYNALIQRYFKDVGGSGLYNNNTQYYQILSGQRQNIVNKSGLAGSYVDRTAYPASGCVDSATPGNCLTDQQIQDEVAKVMKLRGWSGGLANMFYVFTSRGEGSCVDVAVCAFTVYCAYHGNFTNAAGQDVIYANMPYAGTDLNGCGAPSSPNNDIDADSTINVTSHEHMEAVTDPNLDAWYDLQQNEIGDKCAWDFGRVALDGGKANQRWNGHYYILQREWDNRVSGCVLSGP